MIRFESVLGSDASGVVEAVGDVADSEWIGKHVVINSSVGWGSNPVVPDPVTYGVLGMRPLPGTFAECITVPVAQLSEIPSHLSAVEASCLPVAGLTAWRALVTKGEVRKGSTVLVTGAGGGVAVFAIQFAVALGAKVWVTSSSKEKITYCVERLGAIGGADYTRSDWAEALKQDLNKHVRRPAGSRVRPGFDAIIDGAGGASLKDYIGLLGFGGRYVVYGVTSGANADNVNLAVVFLKQVELRGTAMGTAEEWKDMLDFIAKHKIVPVVDRVIAFEDYEQAFQLIAQSQQLGKVVLAIDKDIKVTATSKDAKL